MLTFTLLALYLICSGLVLAVVVQDRAKARRTAHHAAPHRGPPRPDPRVTQVPEAVFRTHG